MYVLEGLQASKRLICEKEGRKKAKQQKLKNSKPTDWCQGLISVSFLALRILLVVISYYQNIRNGAISDTGRTAHAHCAVVIQLPPVFLHLAEVAQELTYILLNHGISEAFPNGTSYVYAGKPNLQHDLILNLSFRCHWQPSTGVGAP